MYRYKAILLRVIDGDTIVFNLDLGLGILKREIVRLRHIDTPELRSKDNEEKKRAIEAKVYVEDWLFKNANDLIVTTVKDRKGKYGRYLGVVKGFECCLNDDITHQEFYK